VTLSGFPNSAWDQCYRLGYTWTVSGVGPSRNTGGWPPDIIRGVIYTNPNQPNHVDFAYDATNGTTSNGWIIRTNKGLHKVPGQ